MTNQKSIVFEQDSAKVLFRTDKNWYILNMISILPELTVFITPPDSHLYRSLQNYLNWKHSMEWCRNHMNMYIIEKDPKFWDDRIMKLPQMYREDCTKGMSLDNFMYKNICFLWIPLIIMRGNDCETNSTNNIWNRENDIKRRKFS